MKLGNSKKSKGDLIEGYALHLPIAPKSQLLVFSCEVMMDESISSTSMTSDVQPVSLHPLICFILHHSALLEMGHEVSALFSVRSVV